jgi:3-hydroxy-9,10-secoandrosta-1,3,5(10)-triene-9,17-dione monooxygenase
VTGSEFLERARALLPVLRERAEQTEQLRRIPDETLKDLHESGLFRGVQPARYGGYELDPGDFLEAILEIASACGSTGWVFGVLAVHNWQMALFPEQAQEDVWGSDTSVLISSSYAPTGQVTRTEGGYRVTGRWSFSSGCDACDWVFLGGIPPLEEGGQITLTTFLIPRRDYRIDDNWHVAGLCGTGSKDIVVEDAFVPEHRTHSFRDAFACNSPGNAVNTAPLYRLPFGIVFPYAITAPAIGVARGALETYREQTRTRISALGFEKVAENPFSQLRLAEAAAAVDDAADRMRANFREMMEVARRGAPIARERRARFRWDAGNAVGTSVHAVDRMFEASGGRAIFLSNPIQRAFRDVHAMRAHAANNPEAAARMFGRSELGIPDNELFL